MQTILIVDDDTAIGDLEQEVLERAGYAVQRAYSGTETLLLLRHCRPDLVLLDLMLPGLTGEEVLPQLQGLPVIVVSAKTDVQDKVALLLGGLGLSIAKLLTEKMGGCITAACRGGVLCIRIRFPEPTSPIPT